MAGFADPLLMTACGAETSVGFAFAMLCCGSTEVDAREPMARCIFCGASSEKGFNIVFEVSSAAEHTESRSMYLIRTKITSPSRTVVLLLSVISS